jgi:hypothetical protein
MEMTVDLPDNILKALEVRIGKLAILDDGHPARRRRSIRSDCGRGDRVHLTIGFQDGCRLEHVPGPHVRILHPGLGLLRRRVPSERRVHSMISCHSLRSSPMTASAIARRLNGVARCRSPMT